MDEIGKITTLRWRGEALNTQVDKVQNKVFTIENSLHWRGEKGFENEQCLSYE